MVDEAKSLLAYCRTGSQSFPAALSTAAAKGAIGYQFDMPHFSSGTPGAANQSIIGYDSSADARAKGDVCQVLRALP